MKVWEVYDANTGRSFGEVRCFDPAEATTTVSDHYEPQEDLVGADLRARRVVRLWHDDIRRPPDGTWDWARTNRAAMHVLLDGHLKGRPVQEASLDGDIGLHERDPDAPDAWLLAGDSPDGDGIDLALAMVALRVVPPRVTIHSMNDAKASYMAHILRRHARDEGRDLDLTVERYRGPSE